MPKKRSAVPPPLPNGTRFGRLIVVGVSDTKDRRGRIYRCRCDCGTVKDVAGWVLKCGDTRSCGCLKRELDAALPTRTITHGLTKHRSYGAWKGMHQRCENPRNPKYRWYGARGIRVCERWSGSYGFARFLADMGERPEGKTLDRIDNDGDYAPDNCRWATPLEQAANTPRARRKRSAA